MTRRCLIILNAYYLSPSLDHFASRMEEELLKLGVTCERKTTSEIFAYVNSDGSLHTGDLPYDFALFLDKDQYIATLLEQCGLRLFNKASAIKACDDKMLTHLLLLNQGIPMPKTVSGPLCYAESHNDDFLKNLMKTISFPMVAKANYGSQGQSVFLVRNKDELNSIEKSLQNQARIYQEFIATSKGFDDRLIVIDGKFYCGYRRQALNDDFRSNIAQGGKGIVHEITDAEIRIAEKAARILGLDYCGIDILDSGNPEKPILCEVNSNAFIQGAERVTGKNIAQAYALHMVQSVYNVSSLK